MKRVLLIDGPYAGDVVRVEDQAQCHVIALIRDARAEDMRDSDVDPPFKAYLEQVDYFIQDVHILGRNLHIGAIGLDVTYDEIARHVLTGDARKAWQ